VVAVVFFFFFKKKNKLVFSTEKAATITQLHNFEQNLACSVVSSTERSFIL